VELQVEDRILLLSILPDQGTFLTVKMVRGMRDRLEFTADELATLNFDQSDDRLTWDTPDDEPVVVNVAFKKLERDIVYDALKELDEAGELKWQHLRLCELFEYEGAE